LSLLKIEFKLNGIEELSVPSLATIGSFFGNVLTLTALYINVTKYQVKVILSNAGHLYLGLPTSIELGLAQARDGRGIGSRQPGDRGKKAEKSRASVI
tara:strand:+ start:130 stop:423 length:294 start_codon:yes stop_codon:yes gene_type:complete